MPQSTNSLASGRFFAPTRRPQSPATVGYPSENARLAQLNRSSRDVQQFNLEPLRAAMFAISHINNTILCFESETGGEARLAPNLVKSLKKRLSSLNIELEKLEIKSSCLLIEKMLKKLDTTDLASIYKPRLRDLSARLEDELAEAFCLVMHAEDKALYIQSEPPFGRNVDTVFPIAMEDIRSAGKCLALGQSTACVFHLMRVMEAGLKGVGRELEVDYCPSWGAYLEKLTKELKKPYKSLTTSERDKRTFYNSVLKDLNTVKMVWRNPTMHIVKSYNAGEAKLIYSAVKAFMQHLADNIEPVVDEFIATGQANSLPSNETT